MSELEGKTVGEVDANKINKVEFYGKKIVYGVVAAVKARSMNGRESAVYGYLHPKCEWSPFEIQPSSQVAIIRARVNDWWLCALEFLDIHRNVIGSVVKNDAGKWTEYSLAQNEEIVGIFGETYDKDYYQRLKSFGFVILMH
jgi:hypothetical protein